MKREIQRLLITGASGLLGSHLLRRLDGRYPIAATGRRLPQFPSMKSVTPAAIDVTDPVNLDRLLKELRPDAIINCAAMTDVDGCESRRVEARRINTEAVEFLARHCRESESLLLHISTDYVFDGKAGPYSEDATPNPINYYGATKLEAERAIEASRGDYIIIRTAFIYGSGERGASKLVRQIVNSHRENRPIIAADDQLSSPTWAGNLADAIAELLQNDFRGIINISGTDYVSRYDFALTATEVFGLNKNLVVKSTLDKIGMAAPRPPKAGLTVGRMQAVLTTKPVGVREGLERVRNGEG